MTTVTKEQVEQVLEKKLPKSVGHDEVQAILNELFPPDFKIGDWVVWRLSNDKAPYKILSIEPFKVNHRFGSYGNSFDFDNIRHATPEEIAAATWDANKPYKVWIEDKEAVRISSDEVGRFYACGYFGGGCFTHEKYEKL